MSARNREPQRRRRDIFVETACGKQRSAVGAAYSAPTELNYFAEIFYKDSAPTVLAKLLPQLFPSPEEVEA